MAFNRHVWYRRISAAPYIYSATVSRGIDDQMWRCDLEIKGYYEPWYKGEDIIIRMPDHTGLEQLLFHGIVPSPEFAYRVNKESTRMTGFSFMWYLNNRYLSRELRQTLLYNPNPTALTPTTDLYMATSVPSGDMTYLDPEKWVPALCTGTGLTAHEISASDEWTASETFRKAFTAFSGHTSHADALKKLAEYLDFVVLDGFGDTPPTNRLYFVPNDSASFDTLLDLPAVVTFAQGSQYIVGDIAVEARHDLVPNRITVIGYPGMISERHTTNTDPVTITLGQHGISGSIGAMIGPRTGETDSHDLVSEGAVTENLSSGEVTSVTITGLLTTDILTLTYSPVIPYYEAKWETAGVIAGTERIREAEPYESSDLKTQTAVDNYLSALQTYYYNTDPNVYHIVFKDRTDLRLLQKIKFTGFFYIPEEELRITKIAYTKKGPSVTVEVTATPDKRFTLERKLKRSLFVDQVEATERIVQKQLKEMFEDEKNTAVATSGTGTVTVNADGIYRFVEGL